MTTYDPSVIRGVRLLIPDVEAIYGPNNDENIFEDDDISIFLDMAYGNQKWAAGLACGTVGRSEGLILKVITNYETHTDGSVLMKQWLANSQELIAEGKAEVELTEEGNSTFFQSVVIGGGVVVTPEGATPELTDDEFVNDLFGGGWTVI